MAILERAGFVVIGLRVREYGLQTTRTLAHRCSRIHESVPMKDFFLPYVSIASSGGEYFQVSFAEHEDSDDQYFLIQRQFESPDGGRVYVESHRPTLCGHFRIRRAELRRDMFPLDLICQPAETVRIRFQANRTRYERLKSVLKKDTPFRRAEHRVRHWSACRPMDALRECTPGRSVARAVGNRSRLPGVTVNPSPSPITNPTP